MSPSQDGAVIELSGKQKRFLRGRGQALPVHVIIGKAGLSAAAVRQVADHVGRHELVKVRLPAGPQAERTAAAERLARAVDAVCVGAVGRTVLLYRPNEDLPDGRRFALP